MERLNHRPFDPKQTLDRQSLGRAIRLFREVSGMSQTALAEASDMSQTAVSNLERGEAFSIESLNQVARGLNVATQELLNASFEIQDPSSSFHGGIAAFEQMKSVFRKRTARKEVPESGKSFRWREYSVESVVPTVPQGRVLETVVPIEIKETKLETT